MFEQHQHKRGREDLRVESPLGTKPILTSVYVLLMGHDGDFYVKGFAFVCYLPVRLQSSCELFTNRCMQ